ncbi:MAG: tRNA 2-thiouridine(34) synthase MnmA [Defluviitaleaceae bacterium]|nr:tRNA 2-thiouridine(34) synthase MnmA [Defluviitaleaceae bacterium]
MNKRVLIAMSGGVDSSAAAWLLKESGYDCCGASMRLFDNSESTCCSLDDVEDARSVCNLLGIPHHVFNFKDTFARTVLARFIDSYETGKTPNPCIDCNRFLKFQKFLRRALELEYDYIATGHYARIEHADGRWLLRKGADISKDQSYVLASMTQEQLSRTLFPLGTYDKPYIRQLADRHGLVNAHKADSQDLCFAPDNDYAAALIRLSGKNYPPGDFINQDGSVLGRHKGIIRYTVGQRKGLGISAPDHLYVLEKRMSDNTVVLGTREQLLQKELIAVDFNWIMYDRPPSKLRAKARIRYKKPESWANVTTMQDGSVHIEFDEPVSAVAPGQIAVLYDGEYVLGGGTIV